MRFDDTLDTVLTADLADPHVARATWRQLIDLIGRGRTEAAPRVMQALASIQAHVPLAVRAASAKALSGMSPPACLVELLTLDDMAVAAPVLRTATLVPEEWQDLLPRLSPAGRAILRHRRDLPGEVTRALEAFGAVDFVIAGTPAAEPLVLPAPPVTAAVGEDHGPFASLGLARLPILPTIRGDNDDAYDAVEGTFPIADVVARIEAVRERRDGDLLARLPESEAVRPGCFNFETDSAGVVRWVEGIRRGIMIGLDIASIAPSSVFGMDAVASTAFRQRARFDGARLVLGGAGEDAGTWLLSAVPAFERRSGRFVGYRGTGRRPAAHEVPGLIDGADAMRQIVHELRTPTNAISGFSEMIERAMLGPLKGAYREQAAAIHRDAGALLTAMDDVDTAARLSAGALPLHPEAIELDAMLDDVVRFHTPLAESRGVKMLVSTAQAGAFGDRRAVERILSRLLGTMVAAAGLGEVVGVALTRLGSAVAVTIDRPAALAATPGAAVLAIDDGAAAGSLLGTGFALRLARNLAREVGGSLDFGGSALTLRLPAALDLTMGQAQRN